MLGNHCGVFTKVIKFLFLIIILCFQWFFPFHVWTTHQFFCFNNSLPRFNTFPISYNGCEKLYCLQFCNDCIIDWKGVWLLNVFNWEYQIGGIGPQFPFETKDNMRSQVENNTHGKRKRSKLVFSLMVIGIPPPNLNFLYLRVECCSFFC
jgi:hypothetical protein